LVLIPKYRWKFVVPPSTDTKIPAGPTPLMLIPGCWRFCSCHAVCQTVV
jgi:hypothetical protein